MDELRVDTWIKSGLASKEYQGIKWRVGKKKTKKSAVIDRSSSFLYKKLLKPSLLSSPKTTALDYAFIISYLKHTLASYLLFSSSVVSLQFILCVTAGGIILKFKDIISFLHF